MQTLALIVAAGRGLRAGGALPKQYRSVAGIPMVRRTIERFLAHPGIDAVLVVIGEGQRALYDNAVSGLSGSGLSASGSSIARLLEPVIGGDERQASVLAGLSSVEADGYTHVLIQDAARPFVPAEMIDRVLAGLQTSEAVLPVLPVVDTLKRVEGGAVEVTVDRAALMRAQTPQGFAYTAIVEAHRAARDSGRAVTDDAEIAEVAGLAVRVVQGSEHAMKITTEQDFALADMLFATPMETRVGTGFDVHRLGPHKPGDNKPGSVQGVIVGGITIPHDRALQGHSDADVALHALTDAVLGAIGDGDIGAHFPPSDAKWKGASSDRFMIDAVRRVTERGGRISHLDLTILCERPKIGPHRDALRTSIAGICGIDVGRVSVKATTTERLGFAGREEGIAAQAVATVLLPATDRP